MNEETRPEIFDRLENAIESLYSKEKVDKNYRAGFLSALANMEDYYNKQKENESCKI
jgi:hypothetical protein